MFGFDGLSGNSESYEAARILRKEINSYKYGNQKKDPYRLKDIDPCQIPFDVWDIFNSLGDKYPNKKEVIDSYYDLALSEIERHQKRVLQHLSEVYLLKKSTTIEVKCD